MKKLLALVALSHALVQAQVKFEFKEAQALPEVINSPYEETTPVFDQVNDILYFTRAVHPENLGGATAPQDVWFSQRSGANWGTASNSLGEINNLLNNSLINVTSDGTGSYLISTYEKKISLQMGFSQAIKGAEGWQRPAKLQIPGLKFKGDFYGGYVNSSGNILIISMETKESKGEEDLYVSVLTNGEWSKPVWLGDSINSTGYEISPYLFDDGLTLMFASNGHEGMGDCDVFYAYRKDSTWTNWTRPVNMGEPINSTGFDAFVYPVEDVVYFASNRGGGLSNIYTSVNDKFYQEAEVLRVAFRSFDTPISDVSIEVVEANGTLVGTYHGKGKDVVEIPALTEKRKYILKPSHEQVDLNLCSVLLLNKEDAPIGTMQMNNAGELEVVPESKAAVASMPVITTPEHVKGMHGVYELDRVPVRNVILALVDENDKAVQYARSDNEGRFSFAETPDSNKYHVKVLTQLEYMKTNGVIYFTDKEGNKLFKAALNAAGLYDYHKLEAREMAQLMMMKELGDKQLDPGKGVFKYDNLPKEGVTLYLLDANDNIVEEVVTDANGQFQFKKLRPDGEFRIKTSDEDLEASGMSKVFFLDAFGRELDVLKFSENTKAYAYKPLSPDLKKNLMLIQEEEDVSKMKQNFVFSVGLFKYKSLPTQGVVLKLYDEKDNVIETVTTDAKGNFVFSMLRPNMAYSIRVEGADDSYLDQSELYFVANDGIVTTAKLNSEREYSFSKLTPQYFFNISQINEGETELQIDQSFKDVVGVYNYKSLPRSGMKLVLVDENDNVIETVYTDAEGKFKFTKLAKESSFTIRLGEEDASMLDESSFVIHNESQEELEHVATDEGGFSFKTLPRDMSKLSQAGSTGDTRMNLDRFAVKESHSNGQEEGKNDMRLSEVFFHFNSVRLSDRDRIQLNDEVLRKVLKSDQPILVMGYACDIGAKLEIEEVARLRADIVKEYLVRMGIPAERIEVSFVSNALEVVENPTTDQRVYARRTEIYHLAP